MFVLLSDPRMSLVSMSNSGRISKRPMLPVAVGGPASACERRVRADLARHLWRDCTRLPVGGGLAWSDAHPAPAVGGLSGAQQHVAQFAKLGGPGAFLQRRGDVFGRTSDLVDAVGEVGGVVGRQHHGIRR